MASNRSNNNNNHLINNLDNSIWEIIENLEENQSLPIHNLDILNHSPDYYIRNAAAGDMAAPFAGPIDIGDIGIEQVIGDWEMDMPDDGNNANEIGDFVHVVGTPDVGQLPLNQIAHYGGGDAELIFDPQLAVQEFNQPAPERNNNIVADGGDQIIVTVSVNEAAIGSGTAATGTEIAIERTDTGINAIGILNANDMTIMEDYMNHRESSLTDVQERSVQEILRLCDYIQRQLSIIAAQIECYENKLNEHYASLTALTLSTSPSSSPSSSSLPVEPDGDTI